MPKRDFEFFLVDMLVALNVIQRKVQQLHSADELIRDEDTWLVVTRSLEIVGEAMKNVLASKNLDPSLVNPGWRDVVDFRNIVIHEYFGLNVDQVFDIVKHDAPSLEIEILNFIKRLHQKEHILTIIDQAIIDLEKTKRSASIDYLKRIKLSTNT